MSFFSKFIAGARGGAAVSPTTRAVARDRLSVILASQRGSQLLDGVCMEDLQRDVMKVVERHVKIAKNRPLHFSVNSEGDTQLFEISVELDTRRNTAPSTESKAA